MDVWHGIAKHTVSVHEKLECNSPTDYHGMDRKIGAKRGNFGEAGPDLLAALVGY